MFSTNTSHLTDHVSLVLLCVTLHMKRDKRKRLRALGRAEQAVMDVVWDQPTVTAEACRDAVASTWPMKDSTIRTVLRRLEAKGFVTHTVDGRTFIYRASESRAAAASRAVQLLIDGLLGGSAEALVIGLVENAVLTPKQLERLAQQITQQKGRSRS